MNVCKLVVSTEPGDPISTVFADGSVVITGTMLGRIWVYDIQRNSRRMLAGFSDDAVRGLYVQDGTLYATIGDLHCRQIRLGDPYDQLETKFNRRSTSSGFKYIFQKFGQITIFYPGMTTFMDVLTNSQSMCPFKLQQAMIMNVCPIDSYQYLLLYSEFPIADVSPPPPRKYKVVDVSSGELRCEIPDSHITHAKFVNERCLIYFSGKSFVVFDLITKGELNRFPNFHRSDVMAMDCSICLGESDCPPFVVSSAVNGSIIVWNYQTGKVVGRATLRQPCFSLGFAYCLQGSLEGTNVHIAVSDDYGVHHVSINSGEPPLQV